MTTRIYVRASTKDQDAERALADLKNFALSIKDDVNEYVENESGTKLDGSELNLCQKKQDVHFLSCLYGSERKPNLLTHKLRFLSCLYGSERNMPCNAVHAQLSKLPIWQ